MSNKQSEGIHLTPVEIGNLWDLINQEIIRLGKKRLWFPTVGRKSSIESRRDFWCRLRDKIQ
jgi:hypothetical protein